MFGLHFGPGVWFDGLIAWDDMLQKLIHVLIYIFTVQTHGNTECIYFICLKKSQIIVNGD